MKVENVRTPNDIETYIEGCINDFELVVHIYKLALKERDKK